MRLNRKSFAFIGALALATAIAVAPSAQASSGGSYVALGDSYSSGTYIPYASTAPLPCAQSTTNYAHLAAAQFGLNLDDVTCGGATVGNFTSDQDGYVPPQFDALTSTTSVVTIGIGGNDNNLFASAVGACGALDLLNVLDIGAPCKATFGNTFANDITSDEPNIAAALQAVHAKSPQAKVFVIGYPDILPQQGRCYPTLPLSTGDVAYLNTMEQQLNAMLKTAATANGATYVDTFTPSIGHDACQPVGVRWIEPLIPQDIQAPIHPNALAEAADAKDLAAALTAAGVS